MEWEDMVVLGRRDDGWYGRNDGEENEDDENAEDDLKAFYDGNGPGYRCYWEFNGSVENVSAENDGQDEGR